MKPEELTLDPQDWESLRAIGHEMLDDMIDYVRDVRERPVWSPPSGDSRGALSRSLPRAGRPLAEVYEEFKQHVLPYPTGNIHPRFWGWVMGNGTPVGLLADLLGSAMNCHVSGYDQGATVLERLVLEWLADVMGFPADASGLLVSGGTMANLVGLTVARNAALGHDVRAQGLGERRCVVYASTETHSWADRSCDLLGLGEQALRKIPVDAEHRIRLDLLAEAVRQDRARGLLPLAIVGNAGTVSCGAIDDLEGLADLAAREGIWLHVDGAFGALVRLSERHQSLVRGMERADSLAFDLHKWGYMQYEVGAVLVRDADLHEQTFSFAPSYLDRFRGGIAVNPTEFASRGVQLSRGFRALKVWMQLSVYGSDRIGEIIAQNIDHVGYLRERIAEAPNLEVLGPSALNVVCFRYVVAGRSPEALDALNTELLVRLQESGVAVPSNARVAGRFALRVAHTNHRSRRSDFDLLLERVQILGRELT